MATHEDLCIVLIESALVVADSRHVLDDHSMVRFLAWRVQDRVGSYHVVDNVGLADFLGAKLFLRAEVLAVVVTQMVVAGNRGKLDTSIDEKVNESRLHLRLARLEIISANEGVALFGELNSSWYERILWRSVDERSVLQDAGNGKDSGRRNFLMAFFDGLEQILSSIVDSRKDVSESFRVGSPEDNDLIEAIVLLEIPDLLLAKYLSPNVKC